MTILQNSGEPIYKQIAGEFRQDILTGKLAEGDYLPSIRNLASDLKISVITTMRAYEMLESEGLVTAVQGKGYYVNAQNKEMLKEQHLRKTESALIEAIDAAEVAGISEEELKEMLESLIRLKHERL